MRLLSLTQQQLNTMLGAATAGDVNTYVLPVVVTAMARLEHQRLRRVLELLAFRHPSLCLRIRSSGGAFYQYIADDRWLDGEGIQTVDAPAISDQAVQEIFRKLVGTIDVENGPLWNVALLRTPDEDHLVFAFHHFAADMLSLPILMRDAALLYEHGDDAAPASDSYLDYVRSIPVHLSASDLSGDATWWVDRPWDAVTRTKEVRPDLLGTHGLQEQIHWETLPWRPVDLRDTERDLVYALALGISKIAGTKVVRLDIGRHGRAVRGTQPSHRRAVGWLAQAVPHFFRVSDGFSPEECARQLDETSAREAYWEEAQQFMCGAGRTTTGYVPFAHAVVNVQGLTFRAGQRSGVLRLSRYQPAVSFPAHRAAHVPVRLTVHADQDALHLRWRVLPVFRSPETSTGIAQFVTNALRGSERR
ncbi:condensation domain-containing protein [Micromonospora sp. NBC_01699]|uniref:condensation domain-containing protein n=1 Tax=Micromonospora sp. NBC_01699 TaxID=2975984 RepID=UPI002E2A5561|nr:condensation domain-containing protein [Micromonospora sp. NBC_01699]